MFSIKVNNFFVWVLALTAPILLLLFRNQEAPADYQTYQLIYDQSETIRYSAEYGYWILNLIFIGLGFSSQEFLAIATFLMFFIFAFAIIRLEIKPYLCMVLIAAPSIMLYLVNGIRQGFAMALILYALSTKGLARLLLLLVACSFHLSSILILLGAYLLKLIRYNHFSVKVLLFLFFFAASIPLQSILMSIGTFEKYYGVYYSNPVVYYLRLLIIGLIFLFIESKYDYRSHDFLNRLILSSLCITIFFLNNLLLSARFSYYAELFIMTRLLLMLDVTESSRSIMLILSFIIFGMGLLYPSVSMQYF